MSDHECCNNRKDRISSCIKRDRVVSRPSSSSGSSSHDTLAPSSKFPIAPVVAHPGFIDGQRFLSDPRVGPFPARRLAWRRVSHHSSDRHSSPDFTLDSSSSGSSLDSSSDTFSGQTHSGASTRVASSRLVYPPVMTPRYSEAFSRWRSEPLSTPYLPTTSESSPDSSFERSLDSSSLSAGPSRKRCKSPTTLIPSSTPVSRSIAPTYAVTNLGIGDGVDTEDGIGMGVEIAASDIREDEEEFEAEASAGGMMKIAIDPLVTGGISESSRGDVLDLKGTLYDIVHYMLEVPLDRITEFETAQR
ncbi:hypothetical protein Tco_0194808 [Tanacetum coccineum]